MPKTVEAPAKKSVKKTPVKATPKVEEPKTRSRSYNGLNGSQIRTLEALSDGKAKTRVELAEATGINKGWSRILGTKEGTHEDALEPMGYIKATVPQEGERGMKYTITASGKQALAKAQKEMAKAGKD